MAIGGSTIVGLDALGKYAFKTKQVNVPEWNGDVLLRELTTEEMTQAQGLAMQAMNMKKDEVTIRDIHAMASFRVTLVALAWVDTQGKPVINPGEAHRLLKEPYTVIEKLFTAVSEMNGIGSDADPVEQAEKN